MKMFGQTKAAWPLALERTAAWGASGTKYSVINFRHLQAMALVLEALLISLFMSYMAYNGINLIYSLISTILT